MSQQYQECIYLSVLALTSVWLLYSAVWKWDGGHPGFLLVEWEKEVDSWQPLRCRKLLSKMPVVTNSLDRDHGIFFFLFKFKIITIYFSSILWFSCTGFIPLLLTLFLSIVFDAVINRIVLFNWGIIDITLYQFEITAWFDTCVYCEMITTISLNIHHHT